MLVGNEDTCDWIEHRAGVQRLAKEPYHVLKFSLQQNDTWPHLQGQFGDREFMGVVGFVDLVSSTKHTRGKTTTAVGDYYRPFLTRTISSVVENYGLVDKTIGDEVMFVLPDISDASGPVASICLGKLLSEIRTHQRYLGSDYRMRVGLAYGLIRVEPIRGDGYLEYSLVGEAVVLAKRLHKVKALQDPATIACAIGMLVREEPFLPTFTDVSLYAANVGWSVEDPTLEDLAQLEDVSEAIFAVLLPKALGADTRDVPLGEPS